MGPQRSVRHADRAAVADHGARLRAVDAAQHHEAVELADDLEAAGRHEVLGPVGRDHDVDGVGAVLVEVGLPSPRRRSPRAPPNGIG